jgi:hypothetical protein
MANCSAVFFTTTFYPTCYIIETAIVKMMLSLDDSMLDTSAFINIVTAQESWRIRRRFWLFKN